MYINLSLVFSENTHLQVMCSLVELMACPEGGREWWEQEQKESGHTLLQCSPLFAVPVLSAQPCLAPALPRAGAEPPDSLSKGRRSTSPSAADYCAKRASLVLSGASTLELLLLNKNTEQSPELDGIQPPRGLRGVSPLKIL